MSALDDLITQARDTGGESQSIEAGCELLQLRVDVEQANWFRAQIEKTDIGQTLSQLHSKIETDDETISKLAMTCGDLRSRVVQLNEFLNSAKRIIKAFSDHDDYILRKTVMQCADEWLNKYDEEIK